MTTKQAAQAPIRHRRLGTPILLDVTTTSWEEGRQLTNTTVTRGGWNISHSYRTSMYGGDLSDLTDGEREFPVTLGAFNGFDPATGLARKHPELDGVRSRTNEESTRVAYEAGLLSFYVRTYEGDEDCPLGGTERFSTHAPSECAEHDCPAAR